MMKNIGDLQMVETVTLLSGSPLNGFKCVFWKLPFWPPLAVPGGTESAGDFFFGGTSRHQCRRGASMQPRVLRAPQAREHVR